MKGKLNFTTTPDGRNRGLSGFIFPHGVRHGSCSQNLSVPFTEIEHCSPAIMEGTGLKVKGMKMDG